MHSLATAEHRMGGGTYEVTDAEISATEIKNMAFLGVYLVLELLLLTFDDN